MYSVAQWEREAISERTQEAMAELRRQGVSVGGARDKAAAALRAVTLRAQGLSLRQIGERLHGERILPPRSDAWHAASVRDLLISADRLYNAA